MMTSAQDSFIWYELMSPDPDGSKAFYDAVVGWDIEPQPAGELDYRMIRRTGGNNAGGVMRLTDEMRTHGAEPCWLGYICVDDVDAAHAALLADGGKSFMDPWTIEGVGRVAMVADPAGAPFYIMDPTPQPGREDEASDVFSPMGVGGCSWNELGTTDSDAALAFYTRHFGWSHSGGMPMGDMGTYEFISRGDLPLGAIMRAAPGQRPHWRYYFRVPAIAPAAAAITANGGTIAHGPQEVPGGDKIVIGIDPQGAEFAIVGAQ